MNYLCFDVNEKITFCSAGRFISKAPSVHPRRTLDTAVLLLGYSGECRISQDNNEYVLGKGCFRILFPGHEHYGTVASETGQSHFWCHFYLPKGFYITEDIPNDQNEQLCILPEFSAISDYEKYFVLFGQLMDEAERRTCELLGKTICDSYIKIMLCSLASAVTEKSTNTRKRAETAKIKEFLRCNACSGITAGEAAKALGYNADYLCRLIKRDSGMTLGTYLNKQRLGEAKNLLLNSNMKIAEIAYACGFSDEKYFMKLFSKYENVTPSKYRQAHFRVHYNH